MSQVGRVPLILALAAVPCAVRAQGAAGVDTIAIRRLANALADDSMRGRGPYSIEGTKTARFLAARLAALGARPLIGTSLLVPFTLPARPNDTLYNVVGAIPPRHGSRDTTLVGITAHYDHLGVGPPNAKGDSIYNGFLDDAIGVAMSLDVARRFAQAPGDRGLALFFFDLEEQGLLGSRAFVADPASAPVLGRLRLVVGIDAGAPAGEALEWELMGGAPAHPAALLADSLAHTHGWTTRTTPPRGISDVALFARSGVPILFPIPGPHWRGYSDADRDWAMAGYDHYHDPADQPDPRFPMVGAAWYAEWVWEVLQGEANTGPHGH